MIHFSLGESANIWKELWTVDYIDTENTNRNKLKGGGNWGKREQDVLLEKELIYWKETEHTLKITEWLQTA